LSVPASPPAIKNLTSNSQFPYSATIGQPFQHHMPATLQYRQRFSPQHHHQEINNHRISAPVFLHSADMQSGTVSENSIKLDKHNQTHDASTSTSSNILSEQDMNAIDNLPSKTRNGSKRISEFNEKARSSNSKVEVCNKAI
jgi:hypothetical protein